MRAAAAGLLALALAACDGVSEAEKTAAVEAMRSHAQNLNIASRSGGFYTLAPDEPVRYVNLSHAGLGARKHGLSIWIVQNDQDRPGPTTVTDARQVLLNEPAFFR
ncbi:MAG: hypothetical protein AAF684_06460, partial [Pseudomonadota bacterium]